MITDTIPHLIGGISQQPARLRFPTQCEAQENALPSEVDGLIKRPPTHHIATLLQNYDGQALGAHIINRDLHERYIVLFQSGALRVFDLDGQEFAVSAPDGWDYLNCDDPERDMMAMPIADYTFILNKTITTAMAPPPPPRPKEALIFVRDVNYNITWTITLNGVTITASTGGNPPVRTTSVTASLVSSLQADATISQDFAITRQDHVIHITRHDGADFTLEASDSRGGQFVSMAKDRVSDLSDLPIIAKRDFQVQISAKSGEDSAYFVKFRPFNAQSTFGEGDWEECPGDGVAVDLDISTMPHALIRKADGSFSFSRLGWVGRLCGDEDSAPDPAFIERRINDIFTYRNRLGLLSDTNVVLSSAEDVFRFFPKTVRTMVDSDPIDIAAAHRKVTILRHAIPFQGVLLIFSDQAQFELVAGDILSPQTAQLRAISDLQILPDVQPCVGSSSVFFAARQQDFVQIHEILIREGSAISNSITANVPAWIPAGQIALQTSTNSDILFVRSTAAPREVFVYKYLWSGGDKQQSAWGKFCFYADAPDSHLVNFAFLNSDIYLLSQHGAGLCLEKMTLSPGQSDPGLAYVTHLDRRVDEVFCQRVYHADADQTTITAPFALQGAWQIVSRHDSSGAYHAGAAGTILSQSANELVIDGRWDNRPFYLGKPYRFLYEFTPPALRQRSGDGFVVRNDGILLIRTMRVDFAQSGYFEVQTANGGKNTFVKPFTGIITGSRDSRLGKLSLSSGSFDFLVGAKSDRAQIKILSESFAPCRFTSASWQGSFSKR